MIRYETSVMVNRPIDEVWKFLMDPFNMPRWNPAWLQIRLVPPGPLGLSSTGEARWKLLGFETHISGTVTEWDPPRAATLSVNGAGLRSGFLRLTLESTADGTRMVRWAELQPRPLMRPLYAIFGPILGRRANQKLKRLFEARPPQEGGA